MTFARLYDSIANDSCPSISWIWARTLCASACFAEMDGSAAADRTDAKETDTKSAVNTIKISGACTLSRQPFPYDDIWDGVLRIIDAFGLDRCMWGTDWTRATELLSYEQGVAPFRMTTRLSDSDKETLMGGTLAKVYRWSPTP